MPQADQEDDSKVHAPCPFCRGDYSISGGYLRHSSPACEPFESSPPSAYLQAVRKKEAEKRAQ